MSVPRFVMYPHADSGERDGSVVRERGAVAPGALLAPPPLPTEANAGLTAYPGADEWGPAGDDPGGVAAERRDGASGLEYRRNRYYDPQSGRFTQEDPLGLAGGMNLYGFAGGDPVNHSDPFGLSPDTLSGQEREQLGDLCNQADCSKIQVHRGNDGAVANATRTTVLKVSGNRSVTLGNDIYLSDDADFATLAHETQHVVQYQKWGAGEYLRQGINERVLEWTGGNPYKYCLNGRGLSRYGMEQQGQIVEDCFRGKTGACWAAKLP